jgi:hypothetical protein
MGSTTGHVSGLGKPLKITGGVLRLYREYTMAESGLLFDDPALTEGSCRAGFRVAPLEVDVCSKILA